MSTTHDGAAPTPIGAVRQWLTAVGIDGPVTLHRDRPWGTVWTVAGQPPTWVKRCSTANGHEPALTQALADTSDGLIPPVSSIDPHRGLFVQADGGRPSAAWEDPDRLLIDALVRWGHLQRHVRSVPAVMAALPDHRPRHLPGKVRQVIPTLRRAVDEWGSARDHAALRRLPAAATRWARHLHTSGIGLSVDHGDLHDQNVASPDGTAVHVIDLGDASLTHPFLTASRPLDQLADRGLARGDLLAVADTYMAAVGHPGRWATLAAAIHLGRVNQLLWWDKALGGPTGSGWAHPDMGRWGPAICRFLRHVFAPVPTHRPW